MVMQRAQLTFLLTFVGHVDHNYQR